MNKVSNNGTRFVKSGRRCWEETAERNKRIVSFTNRKKKTNKIPNKLEELSSAIPGLKHVLDSRKGLLFNALWFLVIGCSFAICSFQIYNRLQFYMSGPVESRVTVKVNDSVKFPSLTLCPAEGRYMPLNHHRKVKADSQNTTMCKVNPIDLMPELNISTIWNMMNMDGLIHYSALLTRLNAPNVESAITFKTKPSLTYYGNCTTFLIDKLVPFQGEDYKIEIRFIEVPSGTCGTEYHTAMFFFHYDDDDITYKYITGSSLQYDYVVLMIGIKAKRFKVLNRTSAPCDSSVVVSRCEKQCLENFLKKQFPCRLPFMDFEDIPLCANATLADAVYKETFRIAKRIAFSRNCSCPDRCEKILYSKSIVYAASYHLPVFQYLFESNIIVDIEENYSYTLIPFICDVGGNLGLFLGLCIPALIDIVQNIVGYMFYSILTARV